MEYARQHCILNPALVIKEKINMIELLKQHGYEHYYQAFYNIGKDCEVIRVYPNGCWEAYQNEKRKASGATDESLDNFLEKLEDYEDNFDEDAEAEEADFDDDEFDEDAEAEEADFDDDEFDEDAEAEEADFEDDGLTVPFRFDDDLRYY